MLNVEPLIDFDKPRNGVFRVIVNQYWQCDANGNPLNCKGFSPQTNSNEAVVRHLFEKFRKVNPLYAQVRFLPVVYVPHDCD